MANGFVFSIGDILNRWSDIGVFAYVLPFLIIFALVYGVLDKTKLLGENKGVNSVIGLSFGLLALQFDIVSGFYASIFPYAGMALAVFLVALILMGLVMGEKDNLKWIWFIIGLVAFLFVLFGALGDTYWLGGVGYSLADMGPSLFALLIIVGLMYFVIASGGKKQ